MAQIDIIIAAYNARATIVRAIGSALSQPQVARVIVVDDCSTDGTPELVEAHFADRPVAVLRSATNAGPARARNRALDRVTAPFAAVLDSDDLLLPGRFDALAVTPEFDIWADNIVFTNCPDRVLPVPAQDDVPADAVIDAAAFIRGNRSNPGQRRRQLGFCKPVFRMDFMRAAGLRYAEDLRLGEDFVLMVQALAADARFRLSSRCGYLAVERSASLSARHGLGDLEGLLAAEQRLAALPLDPPARAALAIRLRETRGKVALLRALEARRRLGLVRGAGAIARLGPPAAARAVRGIAADKLRTWWRRVNPPPADFAYTLLPVTGQRP